MAKAKTYFVRDARQLDIDFYEAYDPEFILRKAHALLLVAKNPELFRTLVAASYLPTVEIDDKYLQTLWAEVYFAEFHQFEAFLALIVAAFQDLAHWVYLTDYRPGEMKTKARNFLDGDYKALTNGRIDNRNDFLNVGIYLGYTDAGGDKAATWQGNLENIAWLMRRIAARYIDTLVAYNAYKHGVRFMASPFALGIALKDSPTTGVAWESETSVRFLETKALPDGRHEVHESFVNYSPVESANHLEFMAQLLKTIKAVRLARLHGETKAKVVSFADLDRDGLNMDRKYGKFSITR